MKKIIIAIISFCFPCMCLADDHAKGEGKGSPSIWVVRHIEVELDNAKDFEAAVAKKTQEYNRKEGADLWATWKVLTGPRTGQYARLFGVSSWADLDKENTTNTINIILLFL